MTWLPWIALALAVGAACHGDRSTSLGATPAGDASVPPAPGPEPSNRPDASVLVDAGSADAGSPIDAGTGPSQLTVHPRRGAPADDPTPPAGPVLVLDSGAPSSTVFGWMQGALFSAPHGDLVVLNASASDPATSVLAGAPFRSVQTLSLGDGASRADFSAAAEIVDRAEAVWFEGGDQARYVRWKGTELLVAVQRLHARGGAIGGSSAGMIILGQAVNDALSTLSENLTTARLLRDPFDPELHFTREVLQLGPLVGSITDPHFSMQDRMGRLVAFMARQVEGPAGFRGVAVDDGIALAIDARGVGRRLGAEGGGSAYVVRGGQPARLIPGQPLRYDDLAVRRLDRASHHYDLRRNCGETLAYRLDVDGALESPYSVPPYASGVPLSDCPEEP